MVTNFNNPLNLKQPQPLINNLDPQAYPSEALPDLIKNAVDEVYGYVKAPYPLIASAAIGAISVALQSKYDVQRDPSLFGPCSTFFLTIADSGERKSTCDHFFTKAIKNYESSQSELFKPIVKKYESDLDIWEAKVTGIRGKIRELAKDKKSESREQSKDFENQLAELYNQKPKPPKIPRLIYSDATPEALAFSLYKNWPSGAIITSEAGIVFGSHAMNKEAIMRNLAMLNTLWDGGSLSVDRKTSDSFSVKGARLSISLQVQEPTLREFFKSGGNLARGTGFLARFLLSWPESTQGTRFYSDSPGVWPKVNQFQMQMERILNTSDSINGDGSLNPKLISLSPQAKKSWETYHDNIENLLRVGGELTDIRDVASKIADNAVRIAGLFQLFCDPDSREISEENFLMASRIADWHLSESKRFFGEYALPPEIAKAMELDSWLLRYCKQENIDHVRKTHLMQHGPLQLRKKENLDGTLKELEVLGRVAVQNVDGSLYVFVNPELLPKKSDLLEEDYPWMT